MRAEPPKYRRGTRRTARRTSSAPTDSRQRRADQLRRRHPLRAAVEHAAHRLLRVGRRVAERHERADRVVRAGAAAAPTPDGAPKLCSSSSLSARSRISCSAFFRPTRGTLCSVATSFSRIARTSRSAVSDDSSPSASAGPTPFAPSTFWKTRRSYGVVKPNSCQPSSFTTRYVCSDAPLARLRQRLVRVERHRELVGDAAVGQDLDAIELLREQRSGDLDDHGRRVLGGDARRDAASFGRDGSRTRPPSSMRGSAGAHQTRERRGHAVGGVGRLRHALEAEQARQHELHLLLRRAAGADDRLLDLGRRASR